MRFAIAVAARMTAFRSGATTAGVLGTLLVLIVAAACIRLGIWQLDRLEQRRARSALTMERMARPPADLDDVVARNEDAAWRRVRLHGGCEGSQIVLAARSRQGSPGVHLLCRFRTPGGRVVLLDRGWLPSPDARTIGSDAYAHAPRDTSLEALIVPFPPGEATPGRGASARLTEDGGSVNLEPAEPHVVYRMNRSQASAATGLRLPAWYVQALGPADRLPVPAEPPTPDDGPHLGYAVQWFSFAAIALVGWLVVVLRSRTTPSRRRRVEPL